MQDITINRAQKDIKEAHYKKTNIMASQPNRVIKLLITLHIENSNQQTENYYYD